MTAISAHHCRNESRWRIEARAREESVRILVLARGYHGAIDACLRNGWEDFLDLLLADDTARR